MLEKLLTNRWTLTLTGVFCLIAPFVNIERTDNIVTVSGWWLMFLILRAQRDTETVILKKLDELIRAIPEADNKLIGNAE